MGGGEGGMDGGRERKASYLTDDRQCNTKRQGKFHKRKTLDFFLIIWFCKRFLKSKN